MDRDMRRAAVAGAFYRGERESLILEIEGCFLGELGPGNVPRARPERIGNVVGLVSPHAGYMYSGCAAAFAYQALAEDGIPDVAVILGPNHHGVGRPVAVGAESEWETPLGTVEVDTDVARAIAAGCRYAGEDDSAHAREHSIEVQLPFLQYIGGGRTRIVPIALAHFGRDDAMELALDLGAAIAGAVEGRSAVVIASTDFTHYESQSTASTMDEMAMRKILMRDARGLITTVYANSISMCGAIGAAVMLEACAAMGAGNARKLTYYTSGDVTGDTAQVVGYGAVSVER